MKKRAIKIFCFVLCFCTLFVIPAFAVLVPAPIYRVNVRGINNLGGVEITRTITPWSNDDNYYYYYAGLDDEDIDLVVSLDIRPGYNVGPSIDDSHAYTIRFTFLGYDSSINPFPPELDVYVGVQIFNNTANQVEDYRLELPFNYSVNQGAATDSEGVIYNVYSCSWSNRGTDILADLAQKFDTSSEYNYETLRFTQVHVVLPYVSSGGSSSPQYEFGFSRNIVFDVVTNENADSSALDGIQGAIEDQNNYQTGIDTTTPNNDFNNASDDYGQLEDDLYSQIDQDSVSGVVDNAEDAFGDLNAYNSAFNLVGGCLGALIDLRGITLYVSLVLTFIVVGIFLNNRFKGQEKDDGVRWSKGSRFRK